MKYTPVRVFISSLRMFVVSLLLLGFGINAQADTSTTDGTTPSNLTPGAPAGSYKIDGFANVNLFNGNLDFHLPLSDIAGRGGARAALMLPLENGSASCRERVQI